MIEAESMEISISRQIELLGLSRSGYYYQPQGENPLNLHLMNLIDEQYTKMPFYGVDKMTAWLRREGYRVNPKRVRRLMRAMGLEGIYPKRKLSLPSADHKKYPYLLRGLVIDRPDQVRSADITYIRMAQGFLYLVAIMDWYSPVCAVMEAVKHAGCRIRQHWPSHSLTSLTAIKGVSLQVESLPADCKAAASGSAWTAGQSI